MNLLCFEDFVAGQTMPAAEREANPADAALYAKTYGTVAGGVPYTAERPEPLSGLYLAALGMRMIFEAFLDRTESLGAPGIEAVEWPNPAFAGDRLRLAGRVVSARVSQSRPDMGLVGFDFAITRQNGECVMTQTNVIMVRRRLRDDIS